MVEIIKHFAEIWEEEAFECQVLSPVRPEWRSQRLWLIGENVTKRPVPKFSMSVTIKTLPKMSPFDLMKHENRIQFQIDKENIEISATWEVRNNKC